MGKVACICRKYANGISVSVCNAHVVGNNNAPRNLKIFILLLVTMQF